MSENEITPLPSERQATEQILKAFDLWDATVKLVPSDCAVESVPAWKLRQYMVAVIQAKTAGFSPSASIRFKVSSCIADMVNAEIDNLAPRDELPPRYGRARKPLKRVNGGLILPDATLYSGGVGNGAGKAIVAQRQRVLNSFANVEQLLREFKRGGLIGVGGTGTTGKDREQQQREGEDNQAV